MTAPEVTPEVPAAELLAQHFDEAFSAPDGIKRLRELILTLAMQGKLVEQDPSEGTAAELLEQIAAEKKRLVTEGKIKAPKPLPPVTEAEQPYEVPQGWAWVRLGDVGLINPRNDADDDLEAAFVPMPLVFSGLREQHQFELRKWGEIKKGFTHFAEGDIGLAKITPCFENAKSCVFKGLPNGIGAGTTELHIFRNSFGSVDPDFLLSFLKNPNYISSAIPFMTGSAGQKRVSTDFFTQTLLPLPPLAEQRRIVARIDQLMARCDELEALREQQEAKRVQAHRAVLREVTAASDPAAFAEGWRFLADHFGELHATPKDLAELRGAILQLAVMGKLVPQDASEGNGQELLRMILPAKEEILRKAGWKDIEESVSEEDSSKPFHLPDNWTWCRLGDIAAIARGGSPRPIKSYITDAPEGLNWIKIGDSHRGSRYITSTSEKIKPEGLKKTRMVYKGDLILSNSMSFGYPYIMAIDGCVHDGWLILRFPNDLIDKIFVYNLFLSRYVKTLFAKYAAGAVVQNLNADKVRQLPFPLPPLAEQRRIVAKVDQLMGLCSVLEERLTAQGVKQGQLLGAVMAQLAPSVAVSRPAATAGSGRRGRPSAAAAAPEGSSGEKRGRGRPRKAAGAEPARSIPQANSEADAIRKLEALRLERAQGDKLVGLFEE